MTTFLNIALLIVGTAATLAAFGGSTWREGSEPILERITARGWISLGCLLVALLLGTYKEIRAAGDNTQERHSAADKEVEAEKRQAELRTQLQTTKVQLELAKKDLDALKQSATDSQKRLDDAKQSLRALTSSVSQTQFLLNEQSATQLATSLAAASKTVSDAWLIVPMTARARKGNTVFDILLPPTGDDACKAITGVKVSIGRSVSIFYLTQDPWTVQHPGEEAHQLPLDWPPHSVGYRYRMTIRQALAPPDGYIVDDYTALGELVTIRFLRQLTGQHSFDSEVFYLEVHFDSPMPAATLYSELTGTASPAVAISPETIGATVEADGHTCPRTISSYFARAFEKAALILVLDEPNRESLLLNLRAKIPEAQNGIVSADFEINSAPAFDAFPFEYVRDIVRHRDMRPRRRQGSAPGSPPGK